MKINMNAVILFSGLLLLTIAVGKWSCMTAAGDLIPQSRRSKAYNIELHRAYSRAEEDVVPPDTTVAPVPVEDKIPWRLSKHEGKVMFITFWAGWDEDSDTALAITRRLHKIYAPQGVVFVAVNSRENEYAVSGQVSSLKLPYPILLDPDGIACDAYDVGGKRADIPRCLAIDVQGRIAAHFIGVDNEFEARARAVLDSLLTEEQ